MKYAVVWNYSAEQKLAEIWLKAANRKAITRAADAIDASLSQNPYSQSESRSGLTRIMIEPPLAVYYNVDDANRRVFVWAIWQPFDRP